MKKTKKGTRSTQAEVIAILIIMIRWLDTENLLKMAEEIRQEGMRRGETEFWME